MNAPELRHNPRKDRQNAYNTHPKNNLTIVLDRVLDTQNIGMCIRLADAVSAKEIMICGEQAELPTNKKIRRSSVMLADVISWSYHTHAINALKSLKAQGTFIVGCELTPNAIDYRKANFGALNSTPGIAIVMGNESYGVSQEALGVCDIVVQMPQYGINRSLNISMALSILGYKILESLEIK